MARLTVDEKLDEALRGTFPASDPYALSLEDEPDGSAAGTAFRCFFRDPDDAEPEH